MVVGIAIAQIRNMEQPYSAVVAESPQKHRRRDETSGNETHRGISQDRTE